MSEQNTPDILPDAPLPDEVPPPAVEPAEEPKADEQKPADADAPKPEDDAKDGDDEPTDDQDDEPKRRRPGKTARELSRVQRELAEMRALLQQQANGGAQQQPKPVPAATEQPPKAEDFTDYEDYLVAKAEWKIAQRAREQQAEARRAAVQHQQAEAVRGYQERIAEVSHSLDDYDETVASIPPSYVTEAMAQAIVVSDLGPQLSYYLGKNHAEAKRIAGLPPVRQIAELGRLEAKLAAPPPPPKTTSAPKPPPTVTGGGSPQRDPNKMTMDEYRAYRAGKL